VKLERLTDLQAARTHWAGLAELSGNVFATWEWSEAWWRNFGAGRELLIVLCRTNAGEVVGILPLYVSVKRPLRIIRFLGHGPSDQLGPLCAPADRAAVAQALRTIVDEQLARPGMFLAERLWGEDGWPSLLGGTLLKRDSNPVLPIGARSFDEFLEGRSRNFREQVRRRQRKLSREHSVCFRLATDRNRFEEDFDTFMRLHQAGRRDSLVFAGGQAAFHRQFARAALERGWLRLWILELDGRPAAAWYGLRLGGAETYYQAGRDPTFDRDSVGFVLLCHSIRSAFEDGMQEYRFGLGPEPYKDRFAEGDPGLDYLAFGAGVRAGLALRAASVARRLPPGIRRRLQR
jgi:CelD/BcsL family acetyltransferase involved in cellulose biosynthesis